MNMDLNRDTQNERDLLSPNIDATQTAIKVGIDLGTSRSAICTSKGDRLVMASVVGWPKDAVSAKVFGRRVLVGDAVLENRMALKTCFPLQNMCSSPLVSPPGPHKGHPCGPQKHP